tara:strand:+ start:284 stop:565 length:282 start_codon:yes stop_codon:yes gene_type:complete
MKLECDTYYFYPDGSYKTTSRWNQQFKCYEADLEQYSTAIRIFGTRKQIDKGLDDYCEKSGLNLDEAYDFEDKDTLKEYKKHYKNKPLIINLR